MTNFHSNVGRKLKLVYLSSIGVPDHLQTIDEIKRLSKKTGGCDHEHSLGRELTPLPTNPLLWKEVLVRTNLRVE